MRAVLCIGGQITQIELSHLAKCGDVHLGVHLRSCQGDVAEMVGDLLHRKPLGQQMCGARVPQSVGAITGWHNAQLQKPLSYLRTETFCREWPERLNLREKNLSMRRSRTHFAEITQDGISHRRHQRIALVFALLSAANADHLLVPVDIFQAEMPYFAAAKPIDSNEQQHGVIANVACAAAAGCSQKTLHIAPLRPLWQTFQLVNARRIDGVHQTGCTTSPQETGSRHDKAHR